MDKKIFNKIAKKCPARNKHDQCALTEDGGTGDCCYDWCPERLRRDVEEHFDEALETRPN